MKKARREGRLHNDSQGIAAFTPRWPGRYILEIIRLEMTPGEFKGKPFAAVRHRGTPALLVVPTKTMEK